VVRHEGRNRGGGSILSTAFKYLTATLFRKRIKVNYQAM
jgi:hypothetical protein